MQTTYSIIIPHYKTVGTLLRCLESIPLCPEAEAIVVDDASGIPLSEMPMHDNPYVHYIMLEKNCGPGVARNRGVEAAKGRWIIFLDADDYFLYGAFILLDKYKDTDFDLVFFGAEFRDCDTMEFTEPRYSHWLFVDYIKHRIPLRDLAIRHGYCHGKMIRREFLLSCRDLMNGGPLLFAPIHYGEEALWSHMLAFQARKADVIPNNLYVYSQRKDSIIHTATLPWHLDHYHIHEQTDEFFRKYNLPFYVYPHLRFLVRAYHLHLLSNKVVAIKSKWLIVPMRIAGIFVSILVIIYMLFTGRIHKLLRDTIHFINYGDTLC